VRAVDQDRLGRADHRLVEVAGVQRHVRAVLAVEDQREGLPVTDAQDHQGRKALGVGDHATDVDALTLELFANEAAHMVAAHPGGERRLQAEAGAAHGGVGGAAAHILGEGGHILQATAHLLPIEVDARSADSQQVQRLVVLSHRCFRAA